MLKAIADMSTEKERFIRLLLLTLKGPPVLLHGLLLDLLELLLDLLLDVHVPPLALGGGGGPVHNLHHVIVLRDFSHLD